MPSLSPGHLSRADDSYAVPALAMCHEDNMQPGGISDRDLSFLSARVIWIKEGESQRVEKDRHRLIKG